VAHEDIEKLKARVEKDPYSRLFLPLAEEYRKSGMTDEAVAVVLRGLARHPDYTSARVSLGRLYLEKKMLPEAKAEFEKVIAGVPDNLFAHRKLADIYRDLGESDRAITEYRMVLNLNPRDGEVKAALEILEGNAERETQASLPSIVESQEGIEGIETAEAPVEALVEPPPGAPVEAPEGPPAEEQLAPSFETFAETPVEEPVSEPVMDLGAESVTEETAGETRMQVLQEESGRDQAPQQADLLVTEIPEGSPAEAIDEKVFDELAKFFPDHLTETSPSIQQTFGDLIETPPRERGVRAEPALEGVFGPDLRAAFSDFWGASDVSPCDSMVAEGSYYKALDAYRDLLKTDPDNRHVCQRIAELKDFLKLIGKGEDMLIPKLEAFLEEIRKRFGGFPE
jgi:tetratricopeptide (TPR) repeat protein